MAGEDEEPEGPPGGPTDAKLSIRAVLGPAQPNSGSQAFPVLASDGGRWYVKAPNNPQGDQILVTEYLVSQVGALIGAPVCTVRPIEIPSDLERFQVVNGPELRTGIGSASQAIPDAVEIRPHLLYRNEDDNARRHAGVFALFDWCWGDDQQWLAVETDEHRLYSHDHGYYFPPGGQNWTPADLEANVDQPHELNLPADGLDVDELARLADALDGLAASDVGAILESVPDEWRVSDEDLEALGKYLQNRAPAVASRLRALRAKLIGP